MCGIVGIFKFDGSGINESELESFNAALHHRGPDGNGIYVDSAKILGLGHTRTSIFDITQKGHHP